MGNPFVHVELHTDDLAKARGFYENLFDWKLEDVPMGQGPYTLIGVGEGTGGGMMTNPVPGTPSHWLAYAQVDDVAAATEQAKSLGASVLQERTEVPGSGWFSVIADPTGATLGLWEPKPGE